MSLLSTLVSMLFSFAAVAEASGDCLSGPYKNEGCKDCSITHHWWEGTNDLTCSCRGHKTTLKNCDSCVKGTIVNDEGMPRRLECLNIEKCPGSDRGSYRDSCTGCYSTMVSWVAGRGEDWRLKCKACKTAMCNPMYPEDCVTKKTKQIRCGCSGGYENIDGELKCNSNGREVAAFRSTIQFVQQISAAHPIVTVAGVVALVGMVVAAVVAAVRRKSVANYTAIEDPLASA